MTPDPEHRPDLLLGLIGDNIKASRSPMLHALAGQQNGLDVRYDRLIPKELATNFDDLFTHCATSGYRGINITYPYKELAVKKVHCADPLVQAIGAVNTVVFNDASAIGFNSDYSGFIAAYRTLRDQSDAGKVCLIGTGGVGRAIAFALLKLEASEIRLLDRDISKAEKLAQDLRAFSPATNVICAQDARSASASADGLVNCTPLGMEGIGGSPLDAQLIAGAKWAFDAVYTPVDTQFLKDAQAHGLDIISGYELFIHQAIHSWTHFAQRPVDEARLRAALDKLA